MRSCQRMSRAVNFIKGRLNPALLLVFTMVLLVPAAARAQGIAGVVRDASGGLLPGVTVEASSPALIEKVRTVVSEHRTTRSPRRSAVIWPRAGRGRCVPPPRRSH
jgi:hypothetical protein